MTTANAKRIDVLGAANGFGCAVSEVLINGTELEVGRACFHHLGRGVYEITMLARNADGFRCYRSGGLFENLDAIPQWAYDNHSN